MKTTDAADRHDLEQIPTGGPRSCPGMRQKVNLIMDGEETELDRTLIEAIRDPLNPSWSAMRSTTGLKQPEVRKLAGKSETGNLYLRAFHEGGQVNIEISDDGGGIDPQRIRAAGRWNAI